MAATSLHTLVDAMDRLLNIEAIEDWSAAVNGLQVENSGKVRKIAAAVDASLATAQLAIEQDAQLLVVHHGLFWTRRQPWTGPHYALIKFLVEHDLAVYSAHLPLDIHPILGNNALLCKALGFKKLEPFFFDKGRHLGFQTQRSLNRSALTQKLAAVLGRDPILLPGGPETCRRIGVVTGGAGAELALAAAEGVDTFITGEGPHWTYALAEELGVNVLYGGHYATETFGVKALVERMARRHRLASCFIDHPTGL